MLRSVLKMLPYFIFLISIIACNPNPELNPREGYVEIEGGKMWYKILGSGKNTPLLILHGGPGGTSRSFYLFDELSADRPLIMFDQLGSGRSDHHQDTSLLKVEKFVEQVEALKQKIGLKEFYLYGHSWGTALALEYYVKYPDGIKAILFNSPYFSTPIWEADADTLITFLADSIQTAIERGEANQDFTTSEYRHANYVYGKHYGVRNKRLSSPKDTVPAPRNAFIYNYMWGPSEFTATGTLKKYHRVEQLRNIRTATLFLTGEFDTARPETVKYFQSLVSGSHFEVIEGAGHGTMHDNNQQNVQFVREFFIGIE